MSYSLSLSAAKADLGDESSAVTDAIAGYEPSPPVVDETREHLSAVADIVPHLAAVLGVDGDELAVRIDGHANVDHQPAEGWADEFIQVRVAVTRGHPTPRA